MMVLVGWPSFQIFSATWFYIYVIRIDYVRYLFNAVSQKRYGYPEVASILFSILAATHNSKRSFHGRFQASTFEVQVCFFF